MVDYYWTAEAPSKSYSEQNGDLVKNCTNLSSFSYHIDDKEFSVNFDTGAFDADGVAYDAISGYSKQNAQLYFIVRKRNGLPYIVLLGYTCDGTRFGLELDRHGSVVSHGNL